MDHTIIDPRTLYVSIGIATPVVLALMAGAWKISTTLSKILNRLDNIESAFKSTVTNEGFAEWLLQLKNLNPDLNVPPFKTRPDRKE